MGQGKSICRIDRENECFIVSELEIRNYFVYMLRSTSSYLSLGRCDFVVIIFGRSLILMKSRVL